MAGSIPFRKRRSRRSELTTGPEGNAARQKGADDADETVGAVDTTPAAGAGTDVERGRAAPHAPAVGRGGRRRAPGGPAGHTPQAAREKGKP
ncbi:hypothetical protein AB0H73_37425, partial [Streptomyces olivoreticuli]